MSEISAEFMIKDGVLEVYTMIGSTVVTVPEGVTAIGKGAFKGFASIEEIILPETVTKIMDHAFKGCRKLANINFPQGLTYIGEYAFHRCHGLREVKLPASVRSLSPCAFLYCDGLVHVSLPGVRSLSRQVFLNNDRLEFLEISADLDPESICEAFTGCIKLSTVDVSGERYHFDNVVEVLSENSPYPPLVKVIARDVFRMMQINDGVLEKFLINMKEVHIPEGIRGIGKSCFFDKKGMTSVTLPKSLRLIGSRAFRNCINLERVVFSGTDVELCEDAFSHCTTLRTVVLPGGNVHELKGLPDGNVPVPPMVNSIHQQILSNFLISGTVLLKYRGSEERVVVPEGITVIGEKAFAGNEAVGNVILPDSVREIHEEAFADCLLLQTINLPEGLCHLGKSAFTHCVKLIRVELPASLETVEKSLFNRCKKLKEVKLGGHVTVIKDLSFYGCASLTQIHFPKSLLHLGDLAFYQCLGLREVRLPKSLVHLGSNVFTAAGVQFATICCDPEVCGTDVFSQCGRLRQITFDQGVKKIGDKFAFQSKSLRQVNLPASIEEVGRNAFEGSVWLAELDDGLADELFLDGGNLVGDVIIPAGTTAIAGGAFYGNQKVTSIVLPDSLQSIGSRAFCGCTGLDEITLPQGIKELKEGVFAYCSALCKVNAHELSIIGDHAFYGCGSLTSVPVSFAQRIGNHAFSGCSSLAELQVSCRDLGEEAFQDTLFLATAKRRQPLVIIHHTVVDGALCQGHLKIPEGVTHLAPYAFSGNEQIHSVTLPASLEVIGEGAFWGCKNLGMINFPSRPVDIGKRAFEKCRSLTAIYGEANEIKEKAFAYCVSLQRVELSTVKSIEKEAFVGCAALEICQLSHAVSIGARCFSACKSLGTFDFSEIRIIHEEAFSDCDSLAAIWLHGDTRLSARAFSDCGRLGQLTLSHADLGVGSYAFSGCTALQRITVGEDSYLIEGYSFLHDPQIPGGVKSIYASVLSCYEIDEKLTICAYHNSGRLIHIPSGIKSIDDEVFKDCMHVETVSIPESVEYIGARAFFGTPWLEKQKEQSDLVVVNHILLDGSGCEGDILLSQQIKMVSGWAFANCFGLTSVSFSSKTIIKEYAFRNCINLKQAVINGQVYSLTDIKDRNGDFPKLVRQIFSECLNCFKTDEEGRLFECTGNIRRLIMPNGITSIGDRVFQESNLLTHITFNEEVTSIGEDAFALCKWLVSVEGTANIKQMGKGAFSGCFRLQHVVLSDKLEMLSTRAFEHCAALTSITIPEGITEIPERAFFRCTSLKTVTLPETLKSIGREAFAFCSELAEIHLSEDVVIDSRAFAWCKKLKIEERWQAAADAFDFCR